MRADRELSGESIWSKSDNFEAISRPGHRPKKCARPEKCARPILGRAPETQKNANEVEFKNEELWLNDLGKLKFRPVASVPQSN